VCKDSGINIEFVYGTRSRTRAGKKGITRFFLVEVYDTSQIQASGELKGFEEVKSGFKEVVERLENPQDGSVGRVK
jgi:hypothetical protein